jgi:hypothetical protein
MPTVGHVEEDFGHGRLGWGKMQDRPCRPLWERYAAQNSKQLRGVSSYRFS